MRVLVLCASYPHPGHPYAGSFNEKSVRALARVCDGIEVLVPRPFAPTCLAWAVPRWVQYGGIQPYELRDGIGIHRPAYLQVPRVGGAFWIDPGAYVWTRRVIHVLHRRVRFDGIISFDLCGAGGLAWRMGRDLGIPSSGWATGGDTRVGSRSSQARVVARALRRLDVVFYQSHELLRNAAGLLGLSPHQMDRDRHLVLPRGIELPPAMNTQQARRRVRSQWGVSENHVVVLSVGRITREKGAFELLEAVSLAAQRDARIACVMLGSVPAFDETAMVQKCLARYPALRDRVTILPACAPDFVWGQLCAADIFVCASHNEGMPNSLLEAMAMSLPSVAFAIPPVQEIEGRTGALLTVRPFDTTAMAEAILRLAGSPEARSRLGELGRNCVMTRFDVSANMRRAVDKLVEVRPGHGGRGVPEKSRRMLDEEGVA